MASSFKKIIFISGQFDFLERISFLFSYFLNRKKLFTSARKYETIRFFEEGFKSKLDLQRAGRYTVASTIVNGKRLNIYLRRNTSDPLVYKQILIRTEFQPILELFRKHKFVPETMVDCGANIGIATLFLKSHFPQMRVIAVEPNDDNFKSLQLNMEVNHIDNLSPMKKGIWSESKVLAPVASEEEMEWGFSLTDQALASIAKGIDCVSLADLLKENKWQGIDYLKIDIEGAEEEIFRTPDNYRSFLGATRVISIEIHDPVTENKITKILGQFGFEVFKTGELTVGHKL